MRILILSDLHLEFGTFVPAQLDFDVVLLAGDIGIDGVAWAKKTFKVPVLYVPGNHEFYDDTIRRTLARMREEAKGSNVHILSNNELVLDGVRFLGTTLWTDYQLLGNQPMAMWDAKLGLKDFKYIRHERFDGRGMVHSRVQPADILELHARARSFLTEKLDEPFDGPTVVGTHHAPHPEAIDPRYRDRAQQYLSAAYASDLRHLMGGQRVALWAFGHTHDPFEWNEDGTLLICNPRGYAPKHLVAGFKPGLVVELDVKGWKNAPARVSGR